MANILRGHNCLDTGTLLIPPHTHPELPRGRRVQAARDGDLRLPRPRQRDPTALQGDF